MLKSKLLIFILAVSVLACKQNTSNEVDLLFKEMMAIHDEVMPKMSDISKAKKELGKFAMSADSVEVMEAIKQLDAADEAMMVWMDEFDAQYQTSLPKEKHISYLEDEKVRVNNVKSMMLTSIEKANLLIQKTKNETK